MRNDSAGSCACLLQPAAWRSVRRRVRPEAETASACPVLRRSTAGAEAVLNDLCSYRHAAPGPRDSFYAGEPLDCDALSCLPELRGHSISAYLYIPLLAEMYV